MSRRLGDDPLTRARSERAKAAAASASFATGSEGQEGAAHVGTQSASRASYNDVFFQRRGGDIAAQPVTSASADEAPEISEISQLPEIRDAATASAGATTFDSTADSGPTSLGAEAPQDVPSAMASTIEVSARPDGGDIGTSSPAETLPQAEEEPKPPITFRGPTKSNDESNSEPPKSGGFFKRLFGKFK